MRAWFLMAAMSTLINGRRAFILDPNLTEIPGELPQGTGGLEFAQAPGSGIGVLMSVLRGAGADDAALALAQGGSSKATARLAQLYADAMVVKFGGPNRPGGVRRDRPRFVPSQGVDRELTLALCDAAAAATGGHTVVALESDGALPPLSALGNASRERAFFQGKSMVIPTELAKLGGGPVVVVADLMRSGGAIDDGQRALRAAALGQQMNISVQGSALFRRVSPYHGTCTTRELDAGIRDSRAPASAKKICASARPCRLFSNFTSSLLDLS